MPLTIGTQLGSQEMTALLPLLGIIATRAQELELRLPSDQSYDFYGKCGSKDLRNPLVLPLQDS